MIDPIIKFIDLIDENSYAGSYRALSPIKGILDGRGVAGIFAHHCKKSVAELDAFDGLLGSTGWGAVCDTRLVLRRQRENPDATLIAGGRDVLHSEYALRFEQGNGWMYQGTAEDVRMSTERREILDLLDEESLSPAEIAKRLGKNYNTTRNLVMKLYESGRVIKDPKDPKYRSSIASIAETDSRIATTATPTIPTTTTTSTTQKRGPGPEDEIYQGYLAI